MNRLTRILIDSALAAAIAGSVLPAAALGAVRVAGHESAASPPCPASHIVVWLNTQGDGAAGSSYYTLELTNLSGHACTFRGYPGVSAVDLQGRQIGSAGTRSPVHATRTVDVPGGATVKAVLRIVQAANFPEATCHRVKAAGLRVYPPGQTASKLIPFPFDACSRRGPVVLTIEAVT